MAPGLFTMMRRNLKKSIFLLTAANGSLWYTYNYTITNDLMKINCRKAASLGDVKLKNFDTQPRHITVILNPVAGKRRSKKLYSKWVEPLLHLAGIKVSLIETESPNQAYDLMKVMSNCDGVAIVGGDGTVHEALNGLLHRPDRAQATKDFPIGIIPTGQYNSIARYIHQGVAYRNQKEFLISTTMSLIQSCIEKHDVLKILPFDGAKTNNDLPVYALRDIRYGKYQDSYVKTSGYMFYQLYIKPYWLRLQRALKNKNPKPQIEYIAFTEPCSGCSRCYSRHKLRDDLANKEQQSRNKRWWNMMAPISKSGPTPEEIKELEASKRDNPDCNKWIYLRKTDNITDFRACMMGDKKVRLSLGLDGEYDPSDITETQDIRLKLTSNLDEQYMIDSLKEPTVEVDEGKKKDKENNITNFLVDNQFVQAHSLEISTLSKCVNVFAGAPPIIATIKSN